MKWIKAAQSALLQSGIVQTVIVQSNGVTEQQIHYPQAFRGYISALAASIVQSGLIPALSIYEKDNKENDKENSEWDNREEIQTSNTSADNNRALLVFAIVLTLNECGILSEPVFPFSDYIARQCTQSTHYLQRAISQALIALKLALRMYQSNDELKCGHQVLLFSKFDPIIPTNIADYDYRPARNTSANLGWLYYRDLYRLFKRCRYQKLNDRNEWEDITEEHQNKIFEQKIATLFNATFTDEHRQLNMRVIRSFEQQRNYKGFVLGTTYPGLLLGAGLNHGVKSKSDIKIGFLFDHTTGLPYIPGSSIKGILRSVFPNPVLNVENSYNVSRIAYLRTKLAEIKSETNWSDEEICILGKHLFEENKKSSLRDIFLDALMVENSSKAKTFLKNDYTTPHPNPFIDPKPIQFIKVLPEVHFCFSFLLNTNVPKLAPGQRILLYKSILLDWGVGAKVSLGYGHLREVTDDSPSVFTHKKN